MRKKAIIAAFTAALTMITGCGSTGVSSEVLSNTAAVVGAGQTSDERVITLTENGYYPDYYEEEVLETIHTVNNKVTGETVSYIFITDMHLDTSEESSVAAYRQLHAIVDIANNTDIDFVCIGGDSYNGRSAGEDGKKAAMANMETISQVLEGCNKPVFIVKGNHDDNSFSAQEDDSLLYSADYVINREEWYSVTMAHFEEYATGYQNGYFYYDLPGKNTRVVCLNMSDSDDTVVDGLQNQMGMYFYGYQDEQIAWLLDEALSRQDCDYIFMCHDAFDYPEGYGADSNRDTLRELLKAGYTHQPFSYNGFTKDFTSWTGNIVIYQSGHLHMERAIRDAQTGGLLLLNTESCLLNKSRGWMLDKGYSKVADRAYNTESEPLFNVVITTGDHTQIVRFGAGDDYIVE